MDPDLLDSLSIYEVAVLAFTSPAVVEPNGDPEQPVVLTAKDAYLWAGAIAHVLIRNPTLTPDELLRVLHSVFDDYVSRGRYNRIDVSYRRNAHHELGVFLVQAFLRRTGTPFDLDAIYARTEDAIRTLEWRGLIEDPFRKRLAGILLSVALVFPVSFTQSTSDGKTTINALTWEYSQTVDGDRTRREAHVKVREVADAFLHEFIPKVVAEADILAAPLPNETTATRDLQQKLGELGYYGGPVDGKAGPNTITALRRFQFEHHLPVTGYLDDRTTIVLQNTGR